MTTWVSSDTHLNHGLRTPENGGYNYEKNILAYCPRRGFPNTPEGLEAMNEAIFRNIADAVSPGDLYIHLGDFALGPSSLHAGLVQRIKDLGVRMMLVEGNHDSKRLRNYSNGWDVVTPQLYFDHEGYRFWAAHIPTNNEVDHVEGRKLHRPRAEHEYDIALSGHVHESWTVDYDGTINVGVDVHDLRPITLDDVIRIHEAHVPNTRY